MFVIRTVKSIVATLNNTLAKFNQTIHGSTDAAAKTTDHIRSVASGMMTAKGVKDCVVEY